VHKTLRVVVDTNVLVSALIGHGKPRRLVVQLLEQHQVVSSHQMLAELADVLSREKFAEVSKSHIGLFLSILVGKATLVTVKHTDRVVSEDPDDDIVLATGVEGKATHIVSGDSHLLNLGKFREVKIVTVKEMLDLI
jgi:uncharacterized protein